MLVRMGSKISKKTTHTSVWIAQDTTESRVPRLNVHTNRTHLVIAPLIPLCLSNPHACMCSFLLILLAIPTSITFWLYLFLFTFSIIALATTVSSLMDEGTIQ